MATAPDSAFTPGCDTEEEWAMSMTRVDGRPAVETLSDGSLAIWAGTADDPHGLAMSPAAALEVGRDLLAATQRGDGVPSFTGALDRLQIFPPAAAGLSGRLRFIVAGKTVDLVIGWSDLVGLAETASAALATTGTEGSA